MGVRRKLLGGVVLFSAMGLAGTAAAQCTAPGDSPAVPDGAVAPEADMAQAGQAVREFVNDTQEYLACLEEQEAARAEELSDEQRALIVQSYNSAVEQMQAVADNFNEQVRRYREAIED